jgi:hypothetical protein
MNGIYLYCVRQFSNSELKVKGISGLKVFTIPYKDIEAVVSTIDVRAINTKEVARKAKEDLNWIITQSKIHEKIVERAMGIVNHKSEIINLKSVIPMKFGMIFEKPQNLEDILRKEYQKFKNLLARFTGKQEWSVKIYAKEPALKEKLKLSEKKVQTRIKQTKNLPRGADYFGELEVNKALDNVMQKKTGELSKKFFKLLGAFALESRQNKILAGELAGHKEPMVANCAYLIHEDKVRDFVKEAKELQKLNPEFIFEYTGPWPPYNFVK